MANSIASQATFISGEKTVTTAGAAERLLTATGGQGFYRAITIIAKAANTNQVYIGGSDVDSSTNDGLDAGDVISISSPTGLIDLNDIWIDVDTDGEGVDFYASK